MEHITINLPAPDQSAVGQAIYALADVLRHVAFAADNPEGKQASAQELLFHTAQVIKQAPGTQPAVAALLDFLMKPVGPGPTRNARSKKSDHLKAI